MVFVRAEQQALPLLWQGRQWFSGPPRPDVAYLSIAAARNLGALEPLIPPQARVLLVTPSPFTAPYDFYLAPRPLKVLMRFDPTLIDKAAARRPEAVQQAERWLALVTARGQLLSDESLRAELPRTDYVVTFLGEAVQLGLLRPGLLPEGGSLEPVAREEQAALYRVVRP